ncbi:MAG: DinB family protein, partial [Asticcacaulis sp.]
MPYPDMAAYAPVRSELDALIRVFIDRLSDEDIAAPLSYRNVAGEAHTKTLGLVLSHVFNHQTHHRGQVTTLLSQLGLDIGVTDLAPAGAKSLDLQISTNLASASAHPSLCEEPCGD